MTEFSKKFLAKSPLRGGLGGIIRVMPRGSLGDITNSGGESPGIKTTYSYGIKQAFRDIKAGVDKKEVMKRYKESLLKGPQAYS
tara:strand:- start:44 stop:295 length:252 start_codon:yes stop_codon:yes gene_type:complete